GLHDLALDHEFARPFQEKEENLRRSQPERDRRLRAVLGNAQQFARRQFEPKPVENECPRRREHLCSHQTERLNALKISTLSRRAHPNVTTIPGLIRAKSFGTSSQEFGKDSTPAHRNFGLCLAAFVCFLAAPSLSASLFRS